jgi:hypothetical protein
VLIQRLASGLVTFAGISGVVVSVCAAGAFAGACAAQGGGGGSGSGNSGADTSGSNSGGSNSSGSDNSGSNSSGSNSGTFVNSGTSGSSSGTTSGTAASGTGTSGTGTTGTAISGTGTTGTATSGTAATGTASGVSTSGTATTGTASGTVASTAFKACPATNTTCAATAAAGALSLSADYQSTVGTGGYGYTLCDPSGSTACLLASALCMAGTTAAGPGSAMVYGSGAGVNIGQLSGTTTTPSYTIPAGAKGISYAFSSVPTQGVQIGIDDNAATPHRWCALVTSAGPATVAWSAFSQDCGAAMLLGAAAPVGPTHINFQVPVATATTSFNFCVTTLAFAM